MCPHTITSFPQGQNEIAKPFSCTFFLFFSLHFLPLFPSVGQIDTFFAKKVGSSHCQSVTSVFSLSLHKWTTSHSLTHSAHAKDFTGKFVLCDYSYQSAPSSSSSCHTSSRQCSRFSPNVLLPLSTLSFDCGVSPFFFTVSIFSFLTVLSKSLPHFFIVC